METLKEKESIILDYLTEAYIFIMILIFPLLVDKTGYFQILECKWFYYVAITIIYIVVSLLIFLYFLIFKKVNYFVNYKLTIIQYLAIVFLIVNIISCFLSPYFSNYNLFYGIGRGEGLITQTLYIISFLFISFFGKFKKRYIIYFSISSILISFISILQYIGFNPFNLYQNGIGTHNVSFISTIGNIDFVSAMYCILLPISFSAYVFSSDSSKISKVIHLLSLLMGFFIIGIIDVSSGKLAFLATTVIIFPFIITNNKRLAKFLNVLVCLLMAYCINIIINPIYHYDLQKIILHFQVNYIVILFIIVCLVLLALSYVLNKTNYNYSNNKKLIIKIYLLIVIGFILSIIVLYFYNFKIGILYEIHELLHGNFNDEFGTYRIFLWKRTLPLIKDYPLLGTGPDTFALRFMPKYTNDLIAIGQYSINDTAANVYLTIAVNLGLVGLLVYLSFIFFQLKNGIKKLNNYSVILLISIICFLIQDFFNLQLVIVTPLFWILLSLHYRSICTKKIK